MDNTNNDHYEYQTVCRHETECPVSRIITGIEKMRAKNMKIYNQVVKTRIEAWKVVKYIAERRIESLENKIMTPLSQKGSKASVKIKID